MNNFNDNNNRPPPEFEKAPDGLNTYGLQTIKNIVDGVWVTDANGKKSKSKTEVQDAYRFVFRLRSPKLIFVNQTCLIPTQRNGTYSARCGLMKLLTRMTKGRIIGEVYDSVARKVVVIGTPVDEIKRTLQDDLITHWFDIMTETKGRYTNIVSEYVVLCANDAEYGSSHDYFNQFTPEHARVIAPPLETKDATPSRDLSTTPTGFEEKTDTTTTRLYPYLYDITKTNYAVQAKNLLINAIGIQIDTAGFRWRTKSRVMQLEKYFIPETLEDDDVPF